MRRTLSRAISAMCAALAALVVLAGCNGPNRSQNPSSVSGFTIDVQVNPNLPDSDFRLKLPSNVQRDFPQKQK